MILRTPTIPDEPYPQWVQRLFPDGIPTSDPLAWETPASDAQMRYLAVLGVRNRWCSREEASQLITRLKRAQKPKKAPARRITSMPVSTQELVP